MKLDYNMRGTFPSNIWVRQDEDLSPSLSAIVLNEFRINIENNYARLTDTCHIYPQHISFSAYFFGLISSRGSRCPSARTYFRTSLR